MKPEDGIPPIGDELGQEAVADAEEHGEHYCRHERQRIELANRPQVLALRAQSAHLNELAGDLEDRIRKAPLPGDVKSRLRKIWWYRILLAVLSISAFLFLVIAFEPFRFGWKGWLYSFGIAILAPLLVDRTIEAWESRASKLWKTVVTAACLAALSAQMLLAVVRGNIMREQLSTPTPVVVVEDEAPAVPSHENNFYDKSLGHLQLVMLLFAGALELGAGVAWREARRWGVLEGEDRDQLWAKLGEVRQEMIACGYEATMLETGGAAFEEQFRRDFDRAFLKRAQKGVLRKLPVVLLALALLAPKSASAAERLNLVIAVDLTSSVTAAKGLDGKTEFDRNLAAVSRLLASVPAGSKVTVVGITDRSFSEPYVLLAAEIDPDEGYFKERIASARQQLVRSWHKRSATAVSRFQRTDLLGSLFVATQLFQARTGRKNVLVLLSDMRQDMPGLNLANQEVVPVQAVLRKVERAKLFPQLDGVEVHVLGVDGDGRNAAYWESLREFWTEYFKRSGATLKTYSMMRELPPLT